jgi:hypothetical protein
MPVDDRGVLPGHLAEVLGRQPTDLLIDGLLSVGPGRVAVGVVLFQGDVVHTDDVRSANDDGSSTAQK